MSDAGFGCGTNFVNPGATGILDSFSMAGGHEYAETITDQDPTGAPPRPAPPSRLSS